MKNNKTKSKYTAENLETLRKRQEPFRRKCLPSYIEEIEWEQESLFNIAWQNNLDLQSFAENYFNSTIKDYVDMLVVRCTTMTGMELYEEFEKDELFSNVKVVNKEDRRHLWQYEWVGVFYVNLMLATFITTKDLIKTIPVQWVLDRINGLHDKDVSLVARQVVEDVYKIICFHNPNEPNAYLSNWYYSDFEVNNIKFTSMEQYFMYSKAELFEDKEIAEQILKTNDFAKVKKLGRKVRNFDNKTWDENKEQLIKKGIKAKFEQNPILKEKLLQTQDAILCECAVKDKVWGIGLSMTNPDRLDQEKWQGQNLLGKALMEVRKDLRNSQ